MNASYLSHYPQTWVGCGAHTVNTIAWVYDKAPPRTPFSLVERITGLTSPKSLRREIEKMGLRACLSRTATWRVDVLGEILKDNLSLGPIILIVGAGPKGLIPHWISVWREEEGQYLVYDSFPRELPRTKQTIGNCYRSLTELAESCGKRFAFQTFLKGCYIAAHLLP